MPPHKPKNILEEVFIYNYNDINTKELNDLE